jgi:type III pantothenate kinase
MNVTVDFGNTTAKVGIFKDDILEARLFFHHPKELKEYLSQVSAENIIASSVSIPAAEILTWCAASGRKITLSSALPLPVKILYETPLTLGVDRIAAVCGALDLYPGQNTLVIDAGTCVNYEFLDASRRYHGGAISPGITMRFEAMNYYTARLPLAKAIENVGLIGTSTETCLQSGVINGIRAEVSGIIQKYRQGYPDVKILLCGGDAHYFENPADEFTQIVPDIVLIGLHRILKYSISLQI